MFNTYEKIPSKYFSYSPVTTPEYYTDTVPTIERKIKGLHIPSNIFQNISIIYEESFEAKNIVFQDIKPKVLDIYPIYHIYFDPYLQYSFKYPNIVATQLLRMYTCEHFGATTIDVIYGDVLLYGSYNYTKNYLDNTDNSIPYEIVERAARLYESHTPPKTQDSKTQVY